MLKFKGRTVDSAREMKSSGIISTGGDVTKAVVKEPFHADARRQESKRS
jgi:hypothetical protein